jgi:hypothetical protein
LLGSSWRAILWVPLQKGWVFDSPQPQMYFVSPPMVTGYGPPRVLFTILAVLPPFKSSMRKTRPQYSGWCRKHRQYPGVAIEVMPCDLATGEKADQRHVAQGLAHHL